MKDIFHETYPCPKTHLHCAPGKCRNHDAVAIIYFELDLITDEVQRQAEIQGFQTEDEIEEYITIHPGYMRAVTDAQQALEMIPRNQCNPLCLS